MRSVLVFQRVWLYRHFVLAMYVVNLLRDAPPSQPYCKGFHDFSSLFLEIEIRVKEEMKEPSMLRFVFSPQAVKALTQGAAGTPLPRRCRRGLRLNSK